MSFLIKNTENLECHTCGEIHPVYTRGCFPLEFSEHYENIYNDDMRVDLVGSHAITTVSTGRQVVTEDIRLAIRSDVRPLGLTEEL